MGGEADRPSVLSSISLYIAVSAASRLAALLLGYTCPMCFLVAPGQPSLDCSGRLELVERRAHHRPRMHRDVKLRTLAMDRKATNQPADDKHTCDA